MENMGPSSLEMDKRTLDLIGDSGLRIGEGRKEYGCQFTSKYQGGQLLPSAFQHQLGVGGLGSGSPLPWFLAGEEEEEEEKMDMLWEDFNEELASVPPLCPLSPVINKGALSMKEAASWLGDGGDMIVVDLEKHGKGKHPRPQPQDGRVVRRRKWSLMLMLRLLKKLFLVKKTRNPRTAPAPI